MAVGLGVALATVEVGGKTPVQLARAAWRSSEAGDWLRDRAALDRIIAKRSNH